VTAAPGIIQADRVRWQRQAAGELARILDAHPGLPAIAWTVGAAGCVLAGRVNGLAPAGQVRDVFDAWRAALALEEHREHQLGGGAIRLTATVFAGEEDDR
jgi:hypothetical protein